MTENLEGEGCNFPGTESPLPSFSAYVILDPIADSVPQFLIRTVSITLVVRPSRSNRIVGTG